jgi:pimeloyl-ACP methyl ester carboxylesterase
MTRYRTVDVNGLDVFFREAGDPASPTLLLLHGFPSSSFMFRELMPLLAMDLHVIAPDYPGFGNTQTPPPAEFAYTFDNLATTVEGLVDALDIERFGIYIQDYGAPVGMRLATRRPATIEAIVVQNGNAYDEGFSDAWEPLRDLWWKQRTADAEAMLVEAFISPEGIKANWTAGARDAEGLCPDGWLLDAWFMALPYRREIQLELLYDYRNNPPQYPRFHEMLRRFRPPTLIAWGERDPYFTVAGARAFLRDLPEAELHLLPTGHFALAEECEAIAELIGDFYRRHVGLE